MSDLFPTPPSPQKEKRQNDDPEHRAQVFAHKFMEKVIREPRFIHAIDHASVKTDNARSRAAAAGIVFGFPDYQILQRQPAELIVLHIEFKAGSNGADQRQVGVHQALARIGSHTEVCRTIPEVLRTLQRAGIWLHGNADNLAVEYQARLEGADRKAKVRGPRKASGKPREPRATAGQIARVHKSGYWRG